MVIELTFKNKRRMTRRVQLLVEQDTLTELIGKYNEILTKIIDEEKEINEVLTEIKDLDV